MDRFQVGKVYWATPVLTGRQRRMVIAIGRDEGVVQLAFVDTLASAMIMSEGCRVQLLELMLCRCGYGSCSHRVNNQEVMTCSSIA